MGLGNRIGKLLELGNKKTIHVVSVRVEASGGAQSRVKASFSKAGKTFLAKVQASGHQSHIPLFQGVVYHPLILLHLDEGRQSRRSRVGSRSETLALRGKQPSFPPSLG